MGYQVKWVEKNLGVTRKALRNFEKMGLMPKNEGSLYRNYSEEDIDRIWTIRLLQGIGYSLKEIVNMTQDENFDFETSLKEKIVELEMEKETVEKHLGYAKTIKLTGRIPSRPKRMGSITFDNFFEKSLEEWNVNKSPETQVFQEMADLILNTPEDELSDTDIGKLFTNLQKLQDLFSNPEIFLIEKIIPMEIIKRKNNGVADAEVQLLVKMLFDNRVTSYPGLNNMTINQFVISESSSYMFGDIAKLKVKDYGDEGCRFIADAIAVFGGYTSYDEVED